MTWLEVLQDHALPVFWVGVTSLVGVYGVHCLFGVCRYFWRTLEYRGKRRRKTAACRRSIQQLATRVDEDDNLLSQEEIERITGLSLEELRQELRSSKVTPLEALRAYQTKALKAHAKTNCLTEAIIEAEEWATELAQRPIDGCLYGVPVSIKDDVAILGYDSAMGCAKLVDVPARGHCAVLKALRAQGAVPFVRTNVPQIEASYEPGNPITGLVYNPHNVRHGPGGSSSGEAALLAAGGSLLGVGSDIGGSLRVPAHFCGLFTLKPTSTRMSHQGVWETLPAIQTTIAATFGPMARDVESLVAACRAFWAEDGGLADLDPKAVRLPFNDKLYTGARKLRIGYYTDNGVFPATPACIRAVQMARNCLEEEGHELLPWVPPDVEEGKNIGYRILQSDAGRFFTLTLYGDEVTPAIKFLTQFYKVPRWIRMLLVRILRHLAPDLAQLVEASLGVRETADFFDLIRSYELYNQRVHDSWTDHRLDALICPPLPIVAPPMPNSDLCFEGSSYSLLYNVLNYPAGVVPMTTVTSADIENLRDYPTTDWGRRAAKKAGEVSDGLPVGVHVVTQRYKEELCLRVMKELQPHSLKVKATG